MNKLGLAGEEWPNRDDPRNWPELDTRLEQLFKTRSRDEWCELLEGSDACFAPVLDFQEAPRHRHNQARGTYIEVNGLTQPAPAPRFSRTPSAVKFPPHEPGSDIQALLEDWGIARASARL
jgi:alpha-methylacyl-CoA racemase